MKIVKYLFVLAVVFCISVSAMAQEEPNDIEVGLSVDFYSQYIWRGQQLTDGYVFQPSVSLSKGGFTGSIWGSLDMDNVNGSKNEFTEMDYSLDYSSMLTDWIGYSVGVIHYDFPSTDLADTTEIYGGLSFDLPFEPSITVYHDVDEVQGTYVSLAAGHSFGTIASLGEGMDVGMDLGVSLGWGSGSYNKSYWSVDDSAMNDLLVGLSFPVELPGGWEFCASVNYSTILSGKIRESSGGDEDHVFTGFSLSKTF